MSRVRTYTARLTALAALLGGLACADSAQAWSFKDRYQEPVGWGGGGGRFFTGSPIDGYGCNVCHQGGPTPKVEVLGLPEGYAPGRLYDIEVVFHDLGPNVRNALHLEFVGRDGRAAGTLRLIDEDKVDARARCDSAPNQAAADYEIPDNARPTDPRHILGVSYCGASHMRFRFGPPDAADVSFAMSVVLANRDGTVEGDGVFNFKKVLRRQGEPAPKAEGCALAAPGGSNATPRELSLAIVATLSTLFVSRRRARR